MLYTGALGAACAAHGALRAAAAVPAGVPDAMHEEVSTAEACATPAGAAEHEEAGQLERDARGERETKGER